VFTSSHDDEVAVTSLARKCVVTRYRCHTDSINTMLLLPNDIVVTGSSDKTIRFMRMTSGG
jgi:WD40 repeat protein